MLVFDDKYKQWKWESSKPPKCFICGENIDEGYYCKEKNKFWCLACEKKAKGFPTCNCILIPNIEHINYRIVWIKEENGRDKTPETV